LLQAAALPAACVDVNPLKPSKASSKLHHQ